MTYDLSVFLIVCPMVFLAGLVDSVAGGGGLVSLPAYLFAGVPPHTAVATNKCSSSMGTLVSTLRYLKSGYLDRSVAVATVLCALVGSVLGSNLMLVASDTLLRYLLIPLIPVVAFYVLRRRGEGNPEPLPLKRRRWIMAAISLVLGVYDGFYGPGTGTFLLLLYTGLAKLDLKTASGNVKLVNLSSNLAAVAVFLWNGQIAIPLGLVAGLFGIAGNYLGTGLVLKRGGKIIRPMLLVVLSLLFLKLLLDP